MKTITNEIKELVTKRLSMHDSFDAHNDSRAENHISYDSNSAKQMLSDDRFVLEQILELLD